MIYTRAHPNVAVWLVRLFVAMFILAMWAGVALAQDDVTVVRVEEDWEMVVGTPASDMEAPQAICTISPLGNIDTYRATFEINHHTIPDFAAGGLQFEIWNGGVALHNRRIPNQALLNTPDEVITWTQSMEIVDGSLYFEISNGVSTTWGEFGRQGFFRSSVEIGGDVGLNNLNAYSPDVSVANSEVGYASNRVTSLILKSVRAYDSDGVVYESENERVVHAASDED